MELEDEQRLDLMRLVDGELPADRVADVARRVRGDRQAADYVTELEADRALLRAAFPPAPAEGSRAAATLEREFAARRRRQAARTRWRATVPLAASALVAAVLGAGAVMLAEHRAADVAERVLAAQAKDRELMSSAFAEALDRRVSGEAVSWRNPDSGSSGTITPTRTFRSVDGRWCREYRQRLEHGGDTELRTGIACRDAERWQLQLERPGSA